jgi:hypothetical protein
MRYPVEHWDLFEVEWANAIEACDVDAILPLVGAALMVRVDAAP